MDINTSWRYYVLTGFAISCPPSTLRKQQICRSLRLWKDGCKSHETDQPTGQLVSQVLPKTPGWNIHPLQENRSFLTHKCGVSGIISFIEMYCAFNHYSSFQNKDTKFLGTFFLNLENPCFVLSRQHLYGLRRLALALGCQKPGA